MKPSERLPRPLSLPLAVAFLALPAALWHGGGATAAAAAIMTVAFAAVMLAARQALGQAQARLAASAAEAARVAEQGVHAARDEARAAARALDALPDAIVETDAARRITRANRAARDLFGAVPGAALLTAIRDPDILAGVDDAFEGRETASVAFALPAPVERHFDVIVLHLDPGDDVPRRVAILFRDVSALRRADRMRADFVANVSHELRTPLTAVAGFVETLQGPARDDAAARQRFLAIMDTETRRMTRLVADLLSLSRIEAMAHAPPTDPVALAALLGRVVEALAPTALARGVRLVLEVEPLPAHIPGDADQIQQVLQNLIDNAVKYGRVPGEVRIVARRGARAALPVPHVEIAVADDGEGIAREHLARLTERFYRVDAGRSRRMGGTGLGLAIVKHIVNRHRGRLTIESEPGRGSVFRVSLPAQS